MSDKEENRQQKLEDQLNSEYTIKFRQREWIVIYNILVSQKYGLGDARIVNPICDKIQAVAAIATNIPPKEEPEKNGILTK